MKEATTKVDWYGVFGWYLLELQHGKATREETLERLITPFKELQSKVEELEKEKRELQGLLAGMYKYASDLEDENKLKKLILDVS